MGSSEGTVILEIPEKLAGLLLGWLEDEAEQHYLYPKGEGGDLDMGEAARQILDGETAPNVEILSQHDPPYAWLLARLYDRLGWPGVYNDGRASRDATNALVDGALEDLHRTMQ